MSTNTFINGSKFENGITATTISSPSLDVKQDKLISGTNIKTVNNYNLLGSGDVNILGEINDKYVAKSGDTMSGNLFIEASLNIGVNNKTNGMYSFAQGNTCYADGDSSHAEGWNTHAKDFCSHAEGSNTIANNLGEHASGVYNVSTLGTNQELTALTVDSQATLFSVGKGYTVDNRENAFEVKYNGDVYINNSLNIGVKNKVNSYYSFAQGSYTSAMGNYSHAEGVQAHASGDASHAEGDNVSAKGRSSHAEGFMTIANGNSSHAEGSNVSAKGRSSHAEGSGTQANGEFSHAEGYGTITNNEGEHACGKWNVSENNTLFSIGNGISDDTRSNAFEIKENGDIYIKGKNDIMVRLQDVIN